MYEADQDGLYLRIHPSVGRRILAVGSYFVLGAVLLLVGFSLQGSFLARMCLVVAGCFVLTAAEWMRRVTNEGIELRTDGLFETTGEEIARWENVEKVERGVLAMKPTNGFSVVLKQPMDRRWAPGLWWRMKRRVGVGGVLRSREAKTMGEQMAVLLRQNKNGAQD